MCAEKLVSQLNFYELKDTSPKKLSGLLGSKLELKNTEQVGGLVIFP